MNEELTFTSTSVILSLCKWRKEKEIQTARGPRLLRTARPTQEFWDCWNTNQREMKAAGLSTNKDPRDPSKWEVLWWRELPKDVLQARAESHQASRAIDAELQIPCPKGLQYRPFQRGAIAYGANKEGTLLADEMGLGKTIEAIGLINLWPNCHRVLVVTKARLKENWKRELEKWLVRPMTVGIATPDYFPRTDVAIINYELVPKFPMRMENYWDAVILDEAHSIKNRKAQRTRAIIGYKPSRKETQALEDAQEKFKAGKLSAAELKKYDKFKPVSGIPAKRRLALTGTPIEQRPEELWTVLNFLLPQKFNSFHAYASRYCEMQHSDYGLLTKGASRLDELQRMLREQVMVRRMKRDVLTELPAKTRIIVELDCSQLELMLAAERKVWIRHEAEIETVSARLELAKALTNEEEYRASVKQLREGSALAFREIARVRHETATAKIPMLLEALAEDLEELGTGKIIFFAHHKNLLEAVKNHFGDICVMVHGETSLWQSDSAVQAFQNDPRVRIFDGSIRACGEGLTLTAAQLVVFGEEDWVPGKMSQCEDRAHRLGQTGNVLVKHYVLNGSIDGKMAKTNVSKQEIIDQALDHEKAELIAEPVICPRAVSLATRRQLDIDALSITTQQANEVLQSLRTMVTAGLNSVEAKIRQSLASCNSLTPRQAALGLKLLKQQCGITQKEKL